MSNSNLPVSLPSTKGTPSSIQVPVPSQPSGVSNLIAADRSRRSGSSSTSSSTPRNSISSPRNNQSQRKQNKASRRPKLNDEMSEAAAIRTSSRKGQTNITHLMNFTLPPRPQNYSHHNYAGRNSYTHRRHNYSWGYNATDKARYIHANYRFIVNPQGNYEHLVSVDDHVEWKDVLQVLVSSKSQSTNCPICLSDPISPRMAKCGHIFCLSCLIRYMHSTDESAPVPEKKARWKRCPICDDSIYISEARPVRWFVGQEGDPPRENNDVVLRLMKRENESNLALPKEGVDSTTLSQDIPWYYAAEVMDYARIMKGSEDYMQSQYNQEIADVELQEKEDELMFGEDVQWTQKAISSIRDAKERVKGIGNPPTAPSQRPHNGKQPQRAGSMDINQLSYDASVQTDSVPVVRSTRSISSSSEIVPSSWNHDVSNAFNLGQNSKSQLFASTSVPTFFFYQALLHYYLSPLDIRILKAEFQDYSLFPSAVLARVEHVSTGHIVDDDLRKRAKYLGHLPHGCEVGFLECDWTDIVSPEILKRFASELDRRRKRNKDKEMREEKERLRAEKEEDDKRLASIRRRRDSISREPLSSSSVVIPGSSSDHPIDLSSSASPPWAQSRTGFTSLASPSTSPNGPRTVWGTTMIPPSESPTLTAYKLPTEPENDGWLQGWEQDLMHEDEVIAQVQAVSLSDGASAPSGGKKKKQKKITLMSTNGRRAA